MLAFSKSKYIFLVFGASLMFGVTFNSEGQGQRSEEKVQRGSASSKLVTAEQLGGDQRYLVYVSLDKPVYREQESVYLRAVFLNASDNTPLASGAADINVQIQGPKGNIVFNTFASGDDSSVGAKWSIPAGTPGGRYKAMVKGAGLGAPQTERSFEIRAYRAPRMKTHIEFARDGYGPSDEVQASIKIDRAEGGVPVGAKVTVIARVDGDEVFKKPGYRLDKSGILSAKFALPKSIEVGDGVLAFLIEDGGVVETASKTLPIILQNMSIKFYPESGDLVAGLASRIYVQANRPDGKPADIEGRIVRVQNESLVGSAVANVKTFHEGRGEFVFTPKANEHYALVLDTPSGITRQFTLPSAKPQGTVLQATQAVFAYEDQVSLNVSSVGSTTPAKLTLYKRDQLVDTQDIVDQSLISLDAKDAEGVLIVTAWSSTGEPLAERLVYRQAKFAVNVSLSIAKDQYVPGGDVVVDILTTDENGKPVESVVGLTVTDDAVLEIIEKREQAPRLPVMVYLENDVNDLADAHVYLDAESEKAPKAVDLLLGTQGWRRFILVNYSTVKQQSPEAAMRALAERGVPKIEYNQMMLEEVMVTAARQDRRLFRDEQKNKRAVPEPEAELNDQLDAIAVEPPFDQANQVGQKFALESPAVGKVLAGDADARWAPRSAVMVREYAHQVRPNRKANDRVDFTETLYWHKGIRTNARDGAATIKFSLSDSVTSFRVLGDAFGRNGAVGSGDSLITSVEPFYIEPKMPLEASVGDIIELPVAVVNASDQDIELANLLVTGEGLTIQQAPSAVLKAGARIRQVVRIVAEKPGSFPLVLSAAAGPFADRVTRNLVVKPNGFPVSVSHGGLVGPDTAFSTEVDVPQALEAGSLVAVAKIFPSPLASMEEALNALLREPNGCFEQTSSTTYPLVMAQQYFMSHQGVTPEKIAKTKALLDKGYKKLIGFESKDKGYEWFGANPGHEALTAYGLMEFVDMAKVMPVDDAMVQRTRSWLLERRDGNGGFERNDKSLDSFGSAPPATTNAYIVWSLLESGEASSTLEKEIAAVKRQAQQTKDSYIIALAANILHLAGDNASATELSEILVSKVNGDGAVSDAQTSITRSGGDSLAIETTSLALLAWLKDDARWAANVEVSMKWLFERSKSGRFGSTQSTVLALKAINAYDAARAQPKAAGTVQLLVDGRKFGSPVAFHEESKGAIELPDFAAALTAGKHVLALEMANGSKMPFAIEVSYNTSLPVSSDAKLVSLETSLSANKINEGEPLELQVSVAVGDEIAPNPIAVIGIPAGLDVQHDQLKELIGASRISSYEVIGREVILYWRALQANEERVVPISLIASVPGKFTGPASRSYLYYTDELKHWVAGHSVEVLAK